MQSKKDPITGAVLNTDVEALNKYKVERKYYSKVDRLHDDIVEIKKSITLIYDRIQKLESE